MAFSVTRIFVIALPDPRQMEPLAVDPAHLLAVHVNVRVALAVDIRLVDVLRRKHEAAWNNVHVDPVDRVDLGRDLNRHARRLHDLVVGMAFVRRHRLGALRLLGSGRVVIAAARPRHRQIHRVWLAFIRRFHQEPDVKRESVYVTPFMRPHSAYSRRQRGPGKSQRQQAAPQARQTILNSHEQTSQFRRVPERQSSPLRDSLPWSAHARTRTASIYCKAGRGGGRGGPTNVRRPRQRSKPTRRKTHTTSTTASSAGITPTGNGDDCSGNSPDAPSAPSASASGSDQGK